MTRADYGFFVYTGWYSNKGKGEKGWEDQLQAQFEKVCREIRAHFTVAKGMSCFPLQMAKDEFGIELQDDVFFG